MSNPKAAMRVCPKCGMYAFFSRHYVGSGASCHLSSGLTANGECIVRECQECGYQYSEEVCS